MKAHYAQADKAKKQIESQIETSTSLFSTLLLFYPQNDAAALKIVPVNFQ